MYLNKIINKKSKNENIKNVINDIVKNKDEKKFLENSDDFFSSSSVKVEQNHIYFYCDVNSKTIYELISAINNLNYEMKCMKMDIKFSHDISIKPVIYLHINSYGGYLSDGFLGSDYILKSKIKIISVIDGYCASSATLLSMVCKERWINKNSSILIHQLRGGCWGKYNELEDNFKNSKKAHKKLIKFYKEYSNLNDEEVENWLKKDIEFTSKKALKLGVVDKII